MKTKTIINKIISVILLITMFTALFTVGSYAVSPTISVSKANGNIGDTVDVTVSLSNNPGIVSMTLKVNYNSNLELVGVTDSGLLPGKVHKATFSNPYILAWANDTSTSNYTVNGTLVTLSFKIKSTATKGQTYDVSVSYDYDNYDIYDKDVNCVRFDTVKGGVTVNDDVPVLTGIAVKSNPTKTTYYKGDTLNTSGLTLTATYNNGKTETISSGFTCTPTTLNTTGTQAITVTYGGKTATFNVTVNAVTLTSIAVKSNPTKTTYYKGDTLNTSGLTLTATYNNGKTETVSSGFTCTPTTLNTTGTQTITVIYGDKVTTFNVDVLAGKVRNVQIDDISMNYKSSVTIGQKLEIEGNIGYTVKYTTSNPSVATVDDNGNVYASGKGSATITCVVTDEYGNTIQDTGNVNVGYAWWQWIIVIVLFGWIWY